MDESDVSPSKFKMLGYASAWAIGMGLVGLLVGGSAEQIASAVSTATTNLAQADAPGAKTHGNTGVDYTPTGAIRGQTALNPCQR